MNIKNNPKIIKIALLSIAIVSALLITIDYAKYPSKQDVYSFEDISNLDKISCDNKKFQEQVLKEINIAEPEKWKFLNAGDKCVLHSNELEMNVYDIYPGWVNWLHTKIIFIHKQSREYSEYLGQIQYEQNQQEVNDAINMQRNLQILMNM